MELQAHVEGRPDQSRHSGHATPQHHHRLDGQDQQVGDQRDE